MYREMNKKIIISERKTGEKRISWTNSSAPCPRCGGTGTMNDGSTCYYCQGTGEYPK